MMAKTPVCYIRILDKALSEEHWWSKPTSENNDRLFDETKALVQTITHRLGAAVELEGLDVESALLETGKGVEFSLLQKLKDDLNARDRDSYPTMLHHALLKDKDGNPALALGVVGRDSNGPV